MERQELQYGYVTIKLQKTMISLNKYKLHISKSKHDVGVIISMVFFLKGTYTAFRKVLMVFLFHLAYPHYFSSKCGHGHL